MAKKFFKKYIPDTEVIRKHKHLQIFGRLLHDANLWHLNRYSVSRAMGIGLFCAFLPIPFQMVLAAAFAIIARANIPISVILVWITNPLTMPPIFYFSYKIGSWILGLNPRPWDVDISLEWVSEQIQWIWLPLLVGSLVCAIVSGLLGYVGTRLFWRYWVAKHWTLRRKKRHAQKTEKTKT